MDTLNGMQSSFRLNISWTFPGFGNGLGGSPCLLLRACSLAMR